MSDEAREPQPIIVDTVRNLVEELIKAGITPETGAEGFAQIERGEWRPAKEVFDELRQRAALQDRFSEG